MSQNVCVTQITHCAAKDSVITHNQQQSQNNFTKRSNTQIQASDT